MTVKACDIGVISTVAVPIEVLGLLGLCRFGVLCSIWLVVCRLGLG